jgi:hypothetical protein
MTFIERGHFINLTDKSLDIKNYPSKEDMSRKKRTSDHPNLTGTTTLCRTVLFVD